MYKGKCLHCGKDFEGKLKRKQYCSPSCSARAHTLRTNPKQLTDKVCARCGKDYRGRYTSVYCSKKCLNNEEKQCLYCGTMFRGHFNKRYCSMKCKDAYKVRKPTGNKLNCIVCDKEFDETYQTKRNINQVCSNACSNYLTSKLKRPFYEGEVENLINAKDYPMSAKMVADALGSSNTMVHNYASERYGTFKEMIIALKGYYEPTEITQSYTANSLFRMIEALYGIKGTFEKEFPDLINPLTQVRLRIDFFLPEQNIAIEYHGEQHFKPNAFFDDTDSFKARKTRDNIKKQYLKKKGIPFVEFAYYEPLTETTIREKLDSLLLQR